MNVFVIPLEPVEPAIIIGYFGGSRRHFSFSIETISKLLEKDVEINIDPSRLRPFDVNNLVCDYTKAQELLGWSPEVSFEDGLQSTNDWVKQNIPDWDENKNVKNKRMENTL